jgi:hypothetical protein
MPTINPLLVPTISPGNIFRRFTEDSTLNIRWLTKEDPTFFATLNRPHVDIALRQLIIAKALDNIALRLGHLSLFPFLIPPKMSTGTGSVDLPLSWVWDMHVSLPAKWEYIRLAKIKRISGSNPSGTGSESGTYTGLLRLIFTGQQVGSSSEIALFYADYRIDSILTYQFAKANIVSAGEETVAIDPSEAETISGYLIFRTLDSENDSSHKAFLDTVQPPTTTTDSNSDGIFDNPAIYEIIDTIESGITNPDDFLASASPHGTGMLVLSATNSIPSTDSDFNTWLSSSGYPFRLGASRTSIHGIIIPKALFREFSIVVPAPDQPTDDITNLYSPVWLSSIERLDTLANELKLTFSTHSLEETPVITEFAQMILKREFTNNRVVTIEALTDLKGQDQENFKQGFGIGHVVLSSLWGATTSDVDDFFDSFLALTDVPAITSFSKENAILSSYALSRVPKYTPTRGQSEALVGSTARLITPVHPADSNRYICEQDQGIGDPIDFRTKVGFPEELRENPDIEPVGYTGSLAHRGFKLVVDASGANHTYETDILPRIRCLLGRDPVFFDIWFDGTYFKIYNGDAWVTL